MKYRNKLPWLFLVFIFALITVGSWVGQSGGWPAARLLSWVGQVGLGASIFIYLLIPGTPPKERN